MNHTLDKHHCTGYCDEYLGVLQMWYEAEQQIDHLKAIIAYQEDIIAELKAAAPGNPYIADVSNNTPG